MLTWYKDGHAHVRTTRMLYDPGGPRPRGHKNLDFEPKHRFNLKYGMGPANQSVHQRKLMRVFCSHEEALGCCQSTRISQTAWMAGFMRDLPIHSHTHISQAAWMAGFM